MKIITSAIVGYGLSGRVFHAPFLQSHPAFTIKSIVSSRSEVQIDFPQVKQLTDFDALLTDDEIDLIVLCSPHFLHFEQAKAAMKAGKHVVIEKPVVTRLSDIEQLIEISQQSGCSFFPYHNRRWDSDYLTTAMLINDGSLGKVHTFESRFERYNPTIRRASWRFEPTGGGTLWDLGPHLIDQAIALFGPPQAVSALLFDQRGSGNNDAFDLYLLYNELTVSLKASLLCLTQSNRFVVHGTEASFVKAGNDVQESMLRTGISPMADKYGEEPEAFYGRLNRAGQHGITESIIPSLPGNYMQFYENVVGVLANGLAPSVSTTEVWWNISILEAARKSHQEKRIILLKH